VITLLNGPVYLPPHVQEALQTPICDLRNPRFKEAYAESRRQVALLLGAGGYATVLAAGSGTFGVELILRSCLRPSDRVIALAMGTFSSRMADMALQTGARVHREWAAVGDVVPLARVEELLASEPARFLLAAQVEPSTGTQVDLSALAALCRRYGTIPIIDGVCSGFAVDVHCARDGVGAFVTASQKGLALPPGMAVAVVSPELLERAKETPESATGMYGHLLRWTAAEPSFTPPILHIFALQRSLEFIARETMPRRAERHRRWAARVADWAQTHDVKPVPLSPAATASTLSALYYPTGLDDAWLLRLRDERGLELAPSNDPRLAGRYFRIGHLGDLPDDHLEQGLSILSESLQHAGARL
jgi:alanine-glyoxylate transaminase / serine-glyoxylate transaminase / serine-pyruvate transaminase